MKPSFEALARIAEIEFSEIDVDSAMMGEKLRLFLTDTSLVDVWLSRTFEDRFGFHWERRHLDGTFYRYDNFPDTAWKFAETFPRHFHNGSQNAVEAAPFPTDVTEGFREFLKFVVRKMRG
ncbi:MAG: hypothetical protein IT313_01270 [Anaerolineales bacterium]|nr:hypothetical protein [Anaerolineales bacterium]